MARRNTHSEKQMADQPNTTDNFIDLVQAHERQWGTELYPDRPSLADLLAAPIVAWWMPVRGSTTRLDLPTRRRDAAPPEEPPRLMASVHHDIAELDKYAARLLLHSRAELPDRRLTMVYINQKKALIRGVRLQITASEGGK
jgi:hypothetical protein